MSTRLHIVVPDDLVRRIDSAKGDVSRSKWIMRAVESALGSLGREAEDRGGPPGLDPSPSPAQTRPPVKTDIASWTETPIPNRADAFRRAQGKKP